MATLRVLSLGFLILATGIGCSESSSTPSSLGDSLAEARDAAREAKKTADEADAEALAPKELTAALKQWSKAEAAEKRGGPKAARRAWESATRKLERASAQAKRAQKLLVRAGDRIREAESYRDEAHDSSVEELAPDLWRSAHENLAKARAALEEKDARTAERAAGNALADLEDGVRAAGVRGEERRGARALADAVESLRLKAEEIGGRKHFETDVEVADAEIQLAESAFEAGEFVRATRHWVTARTYYESVLRNTRQLAGTAPPRDGDRGGASADPAQPDPTRRDTPDIDDIPIPDPDSGDFGELVSLFAGDAEVDGDYLRLHYEPGSEIWKDLDILRGNPVFKGRAKTGLDDYVLAGAERGYVTIPAEFRDHVIVEIDVLFQLVVADSPHFFVTAMGDGANDYYAGDFGARLWVHESKRQAKRKPSAVKEFNKHPTRWVQTREPVTIRMEYRRLEDGPGSLTISLDGEETCRMRTDRYHSGRVGFIWQNVKFAITRITVEGAVDADWVAEALPKKKLWPDLLPLFAGGPEFPIGLE